MCVCNHPFVCACSMHVLDPSLARAARQQLEIFVAESTLITIRERSRSGQTILWVCVFHDSDTGRARITQISTGAALVRISDGVAAACVPLSARRCVVNEPICDAAETDWTLEGCAIQPNHFACVATAHAQLSESARWTAGAREIRHTTRGAWRVCTSRDTRVLSHPTGVPVVPAVCSC